MYSYNKNQLDALFLKFILVQNSTCFGQFLCPSSGVQYCVHSNSYLSYRLCSLSASGIRIPLADSEHNQHDKYLLLCIQYQTPDDGQYTCPKHVEFYTKINLKNQCISLVFIIWIYHDARSSECQKKANDGSVPPTRKFKK